MLAAQMPSHRILIMSVSPSFRLALQPFEGYFAPDRA